MITKFINWIFSFFQKKDTADAVLEKKVQQYQAAIEKIDVEIREVNKKEHSLDDNIRYFNGK